MVGDFGNVAYAARYIHDKKGSQAKGRVPPTRGVCRGTVSPMSSAYGKIARPAGVSADALQSLLPLAGTLRDGTAVSLVAADPASAAVVGQLHALLNRIIEDGDTYPQATVADRRPACAPPQEEPMTEAAFRSYFLSHDAFVVTDDAGTIYGAFYVKPNFPGRCSHVCNGGFIVEHAQRGKGVGTVMANAFKQIAPLLGYKASMFNLVFASNQASVALWRRTGFAEIGRLPGAGRLRGSDTLVDAIMFHCAFETRTVSR
ncbi:hypothetical protein BC831DRAFT_505312 [Entophlyctis helioformis]|nr:hypothetical protein BC831DRAFT_505312 [Entophlyctis helioformis]